MTIPVPLLLDVEDVEELLTLLGRPDVPVDHWPLADRLTDRLQAAIDESKPRTRRRP